jgi:hypothetical protein
MAGETTERQRRTDEQNPPSRNVSASRESTGEDFYDMVSEVTSSCQRYCQKRPKAIAGIIFGLGFMLGWKLKPW